MTVLEEDRAPPGESTGQGDGAPNATVVDQQGDRHQILTASQRGNISVAEGCDRRLLLGRLCLAVTKLWTMPGVAKPLTRHHVEEAL